MDQTQRIDFGEDEDFPLGSEPNRSVQYGILRIISPLADPEQQTEFEVFGGETMIGRDPEQCDIVINNKTLSRVHAILDIDDVSSMTIHDNHSLNKTFRNGAQLKPDVHYAIEGGEIISLGEIQLKFELVDPPVKKIEDEANENDTDATNSNKNHKTIEDSGNIVPETPYAKKKEIFVEHTPNGTTAQVTEASSIPESPELTINEEPEDATKNSSRDDTFNDSSFLAPSQPTDSKKKDGEALKDEQNDIYEMETQNFEELNDMKTQVFEETAQRSDEKNQIQEKANDIFDAETQVFDEPMTNHKEKHDIELKEEELQRTDNKSEEKEEITVIEEQPKKEEEVTKQSENIYDAETQVFDVESADEIKPIQETESAKNGNDDGNESDSSEHLLANYTLEQSKASEGFSMSPPPILDLDASCNKSLDLQNESWREASTQLLNTTSGSDINTTLDVSNQNDNEKEILLQKDAIEEEKDESLEDTKILDSSQVEGKEDSDDEGEVIPSSQLSAKDCTNFTSMPMELTGSIHSQSNTCSQEPEFQDKNSTFEDPHVQTEENRQQDKIETSDDSSVHLSYKKKPAMKSKTDDSSSKSNTSTSYVTTDNRSRKSDSALLKESKVLFPSSPILAAALMNTRLSNVPEYDSSRTCDYFKHEEEEQSKNATLRLNLDEKNKGEHKESSNGQEKMSTNLQKRIENVCQLQEPNPLLKKDTPCDGKYNSDTQETSNEKSVPSKDTCKYDSRVVIQFAAGIPKTSKEKISKTTGEPEEKLEEVSSKARGLSTEKYAVQSTKKRKDTPAKINRLSKGRSKNSAIKLTLKSETTTTAENTRLKKELSIPKDENDKVMNTKDTTSKQAISDQANSTIPPESKKECIVSDNSHKDKLSEESHPNLDSDAKPLKQGRVSHSKRTEAIDPTTNVRRSSRQVKKTKRFLEEIDNIDVTTKSSKKEKKDSKNERETFEATHESSYLKSPDSSLGEYKEERSDGKRTMVVENVEMNEIKDTGNVKEEEEQEKEVLSASKRKQSFPEKKASSKKATPKENVGKKKLETSLISEKASTRNRRSMRKSQRNQIEKEAIISPMKSASAENTEDERNIEFQAEKDISPLKEKTSCEGKRKNDKSQKSPSRKRRITKVSKSELSVESNVDSGPVMSTRLRRSSRRSEKPDSNNVNDQSNEKSDNDAALSGFPENALPSKRRCSIALVKEEVVPERERSKKRTRHSHENNVTKISEILPTKRSSRRSKAKKETEGDVAAENLEEIEAEEDGVTEESTVVSSARGNRSSRKTATPDTNLSKRRKHQNDEKQENIVQDFQKPRDSSVPSQKTTRKSRRVECRKESSVPNDDGEINTSRSSTRSSRSRSRLSSTHSSSSLDTANSTILTATQGRRKLDRYVVMFTGYKSPQDQKIVHDLGGTVTENINECTVLVTDKVRRTCKFLCMVAKGVPIVTPSWIKLSKDTKIFQDPWLHIISDEESEKKWGFILRTTLWKTGKQPLLSGYKVFATKSVVPPPGQLKEIVESAGGQWLKSMPKSANEKCFLISCSNDKKLISTPAKKGIQVYDVELLLTGLLRHELDFAKHTLHL